MTERWMDGLEKVEQERRAGVDKIRHEQEERIRMGWIKAIIKPLSLSLSILTMIWMERMFCY